MIFFQQNLNLIGHFLKYDKAISIRQKIFIFFSFKKTRWPEAGDGPTQGTFPYLCQSKGLTFLVHPVYFRTSEMIPFCKIKCLCPSFYYPFIKLFVTSFELRQNCNPFPFILSYSLLKVVLHIHSQQKMAFGEDLKEIFKEIKIEKESTICNNLFILSNRNVDKLLKN